MIPLITVVAGPVGCGKTTWIEQQLRLQQRDKVLYFSPGTGAVPIDQTRLVAEFPTVKVFNDSERVEFLNQLALADAVYLELGFYLELSAVTQILDNLHYQAIAVLPPNLQNSEWHEWANQIIPGANISNTATQARIWRASSTGEVLDENSLDEFWYELTHGAYGQVIRAKGIFNIADGRYLYADYVAGVPKNDFLELDLPRHLEGRPQRFSGIEVFAQDLDEATVAQTLGDCCLSDMAILNYQEQTKQLLAEEIEA
ncbi:MULTISPECIES: CobW C-terminal domain-containing protein [Calothrix]|uniref:GTP-binding protein n=2 Tax=Calothrix TaxID=1186 RepID=A0ABR8ABG7_9CYAN|nr:MULTISPECIES: GTP-binding protein [Calothrix]MBD2197281.1 GTP-binding protein [Calothrix parietina FACHB-288]MBD2225886.1 GTP-binding protein [Calothrix anomala FACHB-343]